MRAGQPAITVELVVIETQLTDELRLLGTAAFYSRADVENHETIAPVGKIRKTILHLKIVNVTAGDMIALLGFDRADHGALSLPARDFFRILRISEIDHAH